MYIMGENQLKVQRQPLCLLCTVLALPWRGAAAQGLNALPLVQVVGSMPQLLALKSFTAMSIALSKGCFCRPWVTG